MGVDDRVLCEVLISLGVLRVWVGLMLKEESITSLVRIRIIRDVSYLPLRFSL